MAVPVRNIGQALQGAVYATPSVIRRRLAISQIKLTGTRGMRGGRRRG